MSTRRCTIMSSFTVWRLAPWKVASHQLNLVPVDAGGSFGSNGFLHKVAVLAGLGARAAGRPVKYIEDRIDNITAMRQSRLGSAPTTSKLALDAELPDRSSAALQGRRRLRCLFPVRPRHPRQRLFADRWAVQDPRGRRRDLCGLHQQMPARRLPRLRLGSDELHDRADRGRRCRRAQSRSDPLPGTTISSGRTSFPIKSRPAIFTTAASIRAPSTWRCRCPRLRRLARRC